jgi:Ribbon-helix-helix protein, copG family
MFTVRTQVLLSLEQRRRLERMAAEERRSMGALIRDAVDAYTGSSARSREMAAESLLAIGAPVGEWADMKAEIIRGASGEPRL